MNRIEIYSGDEVISHIQIGQDVSGIEDMLRGYDHVYAVMDKEVALNCPAAAEIADILNRAGVPGMLVRADESVKTMDTVMDICSWLLEQGADRDALVLAIGGGITSDMTGFAASIYKRGVRFAYVPTTLLSQVDAAIGGKTGVNFEKYKNILGVIRQPEFTYLCPQVLVSLPFRDFLSGVAEMLKTFIIEDNENYYDAVGLLSDMNIRYCTAVAEGGDEADVWQECVEEYSDELLKLIGEAAKVKAGVVSRDQFEGGERRKLNLGHTFAHAIETLAQYRSCDITHGEAVAMGIILAAELSEKLAAADPQWMQVCDFDLHQRLVDDFLSVGLPINCPFKMEDLAPLMKKDKKAEGGKIHFVLPAAVGDVRMVDMTVEKVASLMA
ncbi:MAG: 3-dehydroquinate synthase [Bacteroidales bacterium]|nr:3-dehydroquinate synthase [Bacteroidales bacterium]